MNYFYIEDKVGRAFAIIEESQLPIVKEVAREYEREESLFCRPMHDKEVWDNTIHREGCAGKRYFSVDSREEVLEFFGVEE